MKKIVVTPAGRKKYLEVLYKNLKKCKDEFDKWIIWVNTDNSEDIDFMKKIEDECDFVTLEFLSEPVDPNGSHTATICKFFKNCIDLNSAYLRLDDDIVFIQKGSIEKLFNFRIKNEKYFLVYGNILNNAIISYIYQKNNIITNLPSLSYDCLDDNSWRSGKFAFILHNIFFEKYNSNRISDFYIENWVLSNFERVSINCISWLGKTFHEFNGLVGESEEIWLSSDKPKEINSPSIIFGESLFCHYSFAPQRNFLNETNTLNTYLQISNQ